MKAIIDSFQRYRFEPRSEQLDPDQFVLALEDIETALAEAEQTHDQVNCAAATRQRKTNRGSLPAHLERIEPTFDVESKACPC